VDVGGFEPRIGNPVERSVGMQLDLRHVKDDAESGCLGRVDDFGFIGLPSRREEEGRAISSSNERRAHPPK
jgi:hypothetical protein